jgi:hypothetical protein
MNKLLVVLLLCASGVGAKETSVSPVGSDLERALETAKSGDTLVLAEGRYETSIELKQKKNLRIVAADGADVIFDGSRALPNKWVPWKDGIWKQEIDFDVWQLFNDDQLVYVARWPDASFEDGKIWRMMEGMRRTDGGYSKHKKKWLGKSRLGLAYDDRYHKPKDAGFREGDSRYAVDSSVTFDKQPGSLAETGKDFTGAVAVLNIGHWLTWARPITEHAAGSDHFLYDPTGIRLSDVHQFSAYHILGLAALDRPNEWWFDSKSKTVYYMPSAGVDPNTLALRGRVRDFGLEMSNCTDVTVSGISFFGAGFFVSNSSEVVVEDCTFDYPATHKFILGNLRWFEPFNADERPNKMPSFFRGEDNSFINCVVRRCNAPVNFTSKRMRVENCLFTDIEWEPNSNGASGSVMIGEDGIFRRNTVMRTGNSEGVRGTGTGAVIELNRMADMSNLQHDGSALNVGTRNHYKVLVKNNWAHDCNRQGVRFDYHGTGLYRDDGEIHGDGVYMKNVTWNTQPNEIKGDRHLVLNNTAINVNRYPDPFKEEITLSLQGFKVMHDIAGNANSLTRNNLARMLNRSFWLEEKPKRWWKREDGSVLPLATVLPGTADHNLRDPGASWLHLRDPANWDFRPKAGSPIVDAGAPVQKSEIPSPVSNFPGLEFEDAAPDIGAYEFGAKRYWIPGRQEGVASMPIPKDGGTQDPLNADLMILEAYECKQHTVYFGTSPDVLKGIRSLKDASSNIVDLPELKGNTTYYWRVDAVDSEDGIIRQGLVWSFKTTEKLEI